MSVPISQLDRITVNPAICHGAPSIRGMRLRVQDILELLASGMSHDHILADYDELEHNDITAAIEFGATTDQRR